MLICLIILAAALAATHGDPDAARLIELAFTRRSAALRMLTRRLLPVVHARVNLFFARRGGRALDGQDAADLAQDVWLSLMADDGRLLKAYDPERGMSLEGYVGMISRRELWKASERAKREKRGGDRADDLLEEQRAPAGGPTPESALVDRNLLDAVWSHLDTALSTKGKLVMRYLYEDGLKPAEAAKLMGVNLQVVYNWQHKIRGLAREWYAAQAT